MGVYFGWFGEGGHFLWVGGVVPRYILGRLVGGEWRYIFGEQEGWTFFMVSWGWERVG